MGKGERNRLERRVEELEKLLAAALERIRVLEADNAELRAENAAFRDRLGLSSRNSSKPPSSDPPNVERPTKPPTGRKPGGQPGHPRHERRILPPDEIVAAIPERCELCGVQLVGKDPDPFVHQVIEVPTVTAKVTNYELHSLTCSDPACRHVTCGKLPPGVPRRAFGPGLTALISLCTGKYRMSKRVVLELLSDVLGIEISLGSVSNLEQEMSAALAAPTDEAGAHVPKQPVADLDETGWFEGRKNGRSKRAWLWVAVTAFVTVFRISPSRGADVAKEILGDTFAGFLVTDRWCAYNWVETSRRQLCWSHLIRDFQGFLDRGGEGAKAGAELLRLVRKMFKRWHRVRDGTLSRPTFERGMKPIEQRIVAELEYAVICAEPKTAGMATEILKLQDALFTFVHHEGIEPTNNVAERQIRPGVLWRKTSFGTQGPDGSRFVERILTVVATLKQQKRGVLPYLAAAYSAWLNGEQAPSLLPGQRVVLALPRAA